MTVSIEAARATLLAREEAGRTLGRERAARIFARLPEMVAVLRSAGAGRVVLFGSLATGRPRPDSDLDIAVEGLASVRYFEILATLMHVAGCPVDLVRLEEAGESLRERIAAEGRDL